MLRLHLGRLGAQRMHQRFGQHGDPVLGPLAFPHQDLAPAEIHILHPQPEPFQQPHPGAAQQTQHQRHVGIPNRRQQALHFIHRQHHRKARRPLRPRHLVQPR